MGNGSMASAMPEEGNPAKMDVTAVKSAMGNDGSKASAVGAAMGDGSNARQCAMEHGHHETCERSESSHAQWQQCCSATRSMQFSRGFDDLQIWQLQMTLRRLTAGDCSGSDGGGTVERTCYMQAVIHRPNLAPAWYCLGFLAAVR